MSKKHKELLSSSQLQLEPFIKKLIMSKQLSIVGNGYMALSKEQYDYLCKAITSYSGSISTIELVNLGITDASALKIYEALSSRRVSSEKHPKMLDFSNNFLTDKSVEAFKSLSFRLKLLNLKDNYLGDEALKFKGSVLSNEIGGINLNGNCITTPEAITSLPCFSDYILCHHQKDAPRVSEDCELIGEA